MVWGGSPCGLGGSPLVLWVPLWSGGSPGGLGGPPVVWAGPCSLGDPPVVWGVPRPFGPVIPFACALSSGGVHCDAHLVMCFYLSISLVSLLWLNICIPCCAQAHLVWRMERWGKGLNMQSIYDSRTPCGPGRKWIRRATSGVNSDINQAAENHVNNKPQTETPS